MTLKILINIRQILKFKSEIILLITLSFSVLLPHLKNMVAPFSYSLFISGLFLCISNTRYFKSSICIYIILFFCFICISAISSIFYYTIEWVKGVQPYLFNPSFIKSCSQILLTFSSLFREMAQTTLFFIIIPFIAFRLIFTILDTLKK